MERKRWSLIPPISTKRITTVHLRSLNTENITIMSTEIQATVSLKVVSRKRRRKCTLKSYDRFTNSQDLRLTIKSDRKVKSGGR